MGTALSPLQLTTNSSRRMNLIVVFSAMILLSLTVVQGEDIENAVERGDYSCRDWAPNWYCKGNANEKNCRRSRFYNICKKSCGAVTCGNGVDDCYDERPKSKCNNRGACLRYEGYGGGCRKSCGPCERAP